jgi:hypothetical protein
LGGTVPEGAISNYKNRTRKEREKERELMDADALLDKIEDAEK